MRSRSLLLFYFLLLAITTVLGLVLCDNFEVSQERAIALVAPASPNVWCLIGLFLVGLPILVRVEHAALVYRIVAMPFQPSSPDTGRALLRIEKSLPTHLGFLAERMGLYRSSESAAEVVSPLAESGNGRDVFAISPADLIALTQIPYWRVKRTFDVVASLASLIILAPIVLLIGILVAVNIGPPVIFWQQRPGLGGRPFKLYKFRTMVASSYAQNRRASDSERLSIIGAFLRHTHLDELPQLLNILLGDMSFVGPRPLLPIDQPDGFASRLLLRPGLTGWAQIKGGRSISAADKGALDIYYLQNVTLAFDLRILLGTIPTMIFGERVSKAAVLQAWRELQSDGTRAR